ATAPGVCAEGADVLVCGNAVFAAEDPVSALAAVQLAGMAAQESYLSTARKYLEQRDEGAVHIREKGNYGD
ncbi:MAG: hypothetical protein IKF96_03080, partial [Eggerthellaceae bacterium]|nr:hypothetical protein [Eggerthellaceae bacterium]